MNNNIQKIDVSSTEYPRSILSSLKTKAPKELYFKGNLDLLKMYGIGFCGSRDVSDSGIAVAQYCAKKSVDNNFVVVSGNARGVDRSTHIEALKNNGTSIFVLPEGINMYHIHSSIKKYLTPENHLIISEFPPDSKWKTWQAMQRNKTILALVKAMLLIEAGEKGGTFSAGIDALKMNKLLYAVLTEKVNAKNRGNKILIEKGANTLGKSAKTGYPLIAKVFNQIIALKEDNSNQVQQSSLLF